MLIQQNAVQIYSSCKCISAAAWEYPYSQELQCLLEKGESALKGLEKLMTQTKIPAEPLKYQHKHAVDWYFIERISKSCINFTPEERPTMISSCKT